MIASIVLTKTDIVPKAEAISLGLTYKEIDQSRIGIKDNKKYVLSSYEYFKDEVTKNENNEYITTKGEKVSNYYIYSKPLLSEEYVQLDENQFVDLLEFAPVNKYPYYIKKTIIPKRQPEIDITLQEIYKTLESKLKTIQLLAEKNYTFNNKCNVHVGGLVTTYNELKLCENACTDNLQLELNNGWRIVAVCVQPNQRRPDYILGRYNSNITVNDIDSAKRGD